jgi:hypothetical protein
VPKGGDVVEERRAIAYSRQDGGETSTVQYLVEKGWGEVWGG